MNPSVHSPGHPGNAIPESELERLSPRIADKICSLWKSHEVESFIASLLMDSRDGARQGFSWEVAQELLFLTDISVAKRAMVAAEATGMPYRQVYQAMRNNADEAAKNTQLAWGTPAVSADARSTAAPRQTRRPPSQRYPQIKKKSFWQRLFG